MTSIRILENKVFVAYPFYFSEIAERSKFNLLAAAVGEMRFVDLVEQFPAMRYLAERRLELKDLPLWQVKQAGISKDFHEHIRWLFGYRNRSSQTVTRDMAVAYTSCTSDGTRNVVQLINGGYGRAGEGLQIRLTRKAAERLGLESGDLWVDIKIEELNLQLFTTGVGIQSIELTLTENQSSRLNPGALLQELVYYLSHYLGGEIKRAEIRMKAAELRGENRGSDRLSDLFNLLLPASFTAGHELLPGQPNRLFTYTAAIVESSPESEEETRRYTCMLAQRYSSDYKPARETVEEALYAPFDNIVHAVSLEGGSIIEKVGPDKSTHFLENFLKGPVKNAYWPLLLLAYNEHFTLLRMSQDAYFTGDIKRPTKQEHAQLENYKERLLLFRMNYRFSHASKITMHNRVYQKWRQKFSLDAVLDEVTQDVEEVEKYLNDQLRKKTNAKIALGGYIFGAIMLVSGIFGSNFKEVVNLSLMDKRVLGSIMIFFLGALLIGIRRFRANIR